MTNRRQGGNLMKLCTVSELETMLESDDIDTRLAAETELSRRSEQPSTWCEDMDVS